MRSDDTKQQRPTTEIRDLPAVEAVETDDANKVKGGTHDVVSPRDPASGMPTGKRL